MSELVTLVGLSGSGKSAVGRCLAGTLGRPFVDVDDLVHRMTGRTPVELIDREGEARFRQVEAAAVADAANRPGTVIATGGGAVIDPLSRWALWSAGPVVWLDAPDDRLLDRLRHDATERPLLRGAGATATPEARMARLRAEREAFYRAADATIDATGPIEAVTADVLAAITASSRAASTASSRAASTRSFRLPVGSPGHATLAGPARLPGTLFDARVPRAHPQGPIDARIVLGWCLAPGTIGDILGDASTGVPFVVSDARAASALPELLAVLPGARRLSVRTGERAKRLRTVERLLEAGAALGLERGDAWVAVGGGTATDLIGTAAALYHRGAPLVNVPTTWLAQADAAIGGKVGVDLASAKNAAGAFWPPVAVIGDVAALGTLPRARLLDGMAESLKCGLIGDEALWRLIEARGHAALDQARPDVAARYAIVERAARLKLAVVARDPYETGERRTLNLGHTLGHALEIESGFRLSHGQAVALGLRAVARIAAARGAEPALAEQIDALLGRLGFPLRRRFDPAAVRAALATDKKRRHGRQRWILPLAVGRVVEVDDVGDAELDAAMAVIHADRDEGAGRRTSQRRASCASS